MNQSYSVTFGYDGPFSATARGLVPAVVTDGFVAEDPTGDCSPWSPNAQLIPATALQAPRTPGSRCSTPTWHRAATSTCACTVARSEWVGALTLTSEEEVNLLNRTPGDYTFVVLGWSVVDSSPFKLHTWLLGSAAPGNMTVTAPAIATMGTTSPVDLNFSGWSAGTKYLGSVAYAADRVVLPNPTIVRVDVP